MLTTINKKKNVNISNLRDEFIESMVISGLSRASISAYKQRLNLFLNWCNDNNLITVNDLNSEVFSLYLNFLYNRNQFTKPENKLTKSTIAKHVDFLRKFAKFLMDKQYTFINFAEKLVRPIPRYRVIEAFTDEQINLIFESISKIRTSKISRMQISLLLFILLDTGMRISEALSLRPIDIDFHRRVIRVLGKGDTERFVPFSKESSRFLQEWIAFRGIEREEYIWKSRTGKPLTTALFRNALLTIKRNLGSQMGIDRVRMSPHTFRHTFAKNWILNGGDAISLQNILGHSTMEMTKKYVRLWGVDLVKQHDMYCPSKNIKFELKI